MLAARFTNSHSSLDSWSFLSMSGHTRDSLADCGEDPDEFIDDVEMAAEAWDSAKGDKADAAALEKSLLRFFRQNLERNFEAAWWWQGLSKADRGNWDAVKKAFLEKFSGPSSTGSDVDYDETNEILALTQKAGQSIEEYVREAEKLSRRVKPVLKHTLAAAVIKGLNDEQKRREVSFALSGTKFDFEGAVEKIKAAYRCIGEPDPFKPKDNTRMWASNNPFWSVPGGAGPSAIPVMNAMGPPPIMNAMGPPPIPVMAALGHRRTASYDSGTQSHVNANTDRPSTADGVMPGPMAQEDFNRYMDAYMRKQKGSDFLPPAQGPLANAPAVRGAGAWTTCYSCGKRGHRATECTEPHSPGKTSSRFVRGLLWKYRSTGTADRQWAVRIHRRLRRRPTLSAWLECIRSWRNRHRSCTA
jgi:hypothetical protein